MIITSRNNAPISNYGGGFRCKSQKLTFSNSFQKNREKQKKKITEKREFLRKTSFRPNRFFFLWLPLKFSIDKKFLNDQKFKFLRKFVKTMNICKVENLIQVIQTAPNVQQSGTYLPAFFFILTTKTTFHKIYSLLRCRFRSESTIDDAGSAITYRIIFCVKFNSEDEIILSMRKIKNQRIRPKMYSEGFPQMYN
ncbi:Uncharacterized protein FWK35_00015117, partial [Aphis craccivora]